MVPVFCTLAKTTACQLRTTTGASAAVQLVDLVAERPQDLQLDPILRPARGPLHADQVIQRRNADDERFTDFRILGMGFELVVAGDSRRRAKEIEVTEVSCQREMITAFQCRPVRMEREVWRSAAEDRSKLAQDCREAVEIVSVPRVADIQIDRQRRGTMCLCRQAANEHEANSVRLQPPEDMERVEATMHGYRRMRMLGIIRASSTASLIRSRGVSFNRSRIRVRSTPIPSRGSSASS